ncbi:LOW QUALITY PROTEIN: semaphorin-4B [Rhinatrema bivittatum]|uniref:LOW QUALITY PROTEIN: semaphorin-4B n=1 Tax=Rhinatrema bivittatum TaxID=194408 RepID=UPI00112C5EB7|nr:LOW QUALITY PROTEIN: semaphorin-4B [Rhinatrema bivittatum]
MGLGCWLRGALLALLSARLLPAVTAEEEEEEVIPRVSFQYGSSDRRLKWFEAEGASHYTTLLLSKDGQTLYLGAREALFAVNSTSFQSSHLSWKADEETKKRCASKGKDSERDCQNYVKILLQLNATHLYTCGTYAFSPFCAYIKIQDFSLEKNASGNPVLEDGKVRCPFDPEYKSTAIMVDGELYAGIISNFKGNEPIIYKSQESRIALKTESSLNWLQDPAFVGSAYIQESLPNAVGNDDKIYFFFSETGKEFDFFENTIVSRIARVCKGDLGGERVLQRRWTTFLKAQLLCSTPDDGLPFNVLQDMFVLTPRGEHWNSTVFYGVFTSQWSKGGTGSSAVCEFTMDDVQTAFSGLYKEVNRETQQWYTYTHPVPDPRPGACITNSARHMKIQSSLQMPDRVLNFIKDHFLMDSAVRSQPLLLQTRVRYQQISVQQVEGLKKTYNVLFLGTDDGRLHKAVIVNRKVHIIEEMKLFQDRHPVQDLLLNPSQGLLYASSYSAVVQVPVSNCSMYRSCGECILSRDPYCAWSGKVCRSVSPYAEDPNTSHLIQDIEEADTEKYCKQGNVSLANPRVNRPTAEDTQCQKIWLPPNAVRALPCKLLSNLASRRWVHNGERINTSYLVMPDGNLILVGSPDRLGSYECWSVEEGFQKLMANYCMESEETLKTATLKLDTVKAIPDGAYVNEIFMNTSRSISPSESHATKLTGKTYWNEFMVMSILFGVAVVILGLFLLYRHRDGMKSFLKQGECPDVQHKKPRKVGKPAENHPLTGNNIPSTLPDHKGYQTLNDNYIISTPVHDALVSSKSFSESEKRPLNIRDTHVEVSPTCQRPRVRLGSEIRDSVV